MEALQFELNPFSFIAVPLFIIGIVSTAYLFTIKEKTTAIKFMTACLAGFPIGMLSMFASSIVLWGIAFIPLSDAFAVFSMAALIGFIYHYPRRVHSLEASLMLIFAGGLSLIAFGFSFYFAYQILINNAFEQTVQNIYWSLNPLIFLVALGSSLRRTIKVQQEASYQNGKPGFVTTFWNPSNRQARVLRNYSLALTIGLIQGIASLLGTAGVVASTLLTYILNLSLLFMISAVVYASLDLTHKQPALIIRLIGLTLAGSG